MGPLPLAGSGIYEYPLWMASIEDRNFFRVSSVVLVTIGRLLIFVSCGLYEYAFLFVLCRREP